MKNWTVKNTVHQDSADCGRELLHPCVARVRPPYFFFVFSGCEQCITGFSPRKRQNSAQLQGLSRVFPIFPHSALTKKGPENDKIAHRNRGQWHPFRFDFIVIIGGDRGALVITPLFYYFYSRASGACNGHASSVPRWCATVAARAVSWRRQKFTSVTPEDAPGSDLSTVAARYLKQCPVKLRRSVFSRTSLSLSCRLKIQVRSLMLVWSLLWSLRFWFCFYYWFIQIVPFN